MSTAETQSQAVTNDSSQFGKDDFSVPEPEIAGVHSCQNGGHGEHVWDAESTRVETSQ